jgi:serine/threonine-protein kinase HipA
MPAVAELHLWMNGMPVGVWSTLRGGTPVLRYHPSWAAAEEGRALSLSLPITAGLEHRGDAVRHYFENLLPDSADIRRRLRRRFHAPSTEAFDLLTAIGRDCVGALQLLPPDTGPDGWNRIEAEKLSEVEVEHALLACASDGPFDEGESDDLRISIAGAQEKTALLRMAGKWHRPRGATPTTHILKLPLGRVGNMRADMSDSVENEWLCAQIMAGLGIPMATTEMARFGNTKALVVARFDRRWQGIEPDAERKARFKPPAGAWIARLPQEDFCQALGVSPDRKYPSEGGPSMRDGLQVLAAAEHAEEDRATFVLAQLAFWLLAATDGHAKNFSLHHRRGARFGLTPLYDVLSAWPIIGAGPHLLPYERAKLAMGLRSTNMHYRLRDMQPRHWKHLADTCGASVWPRMLQMAEGAEDVLDAVEQRLPADFPPRTWRPIAAGVKRHAAQFLRTAKEPGG